MKTNPQQIADKATTRLVEDLDRTLATALREIAECPDDKVEAALRREHAALADRLAEARRRPAGKAAAAVKAVVRPIQDFGKAAVARVEAAGARRARLHAQRELQLKVTQALLAVGTIDEPVLARPLIAAQRQHRANLDRIESIKDDWSAFGECGAAAAAIDAFLAVAADAQGMTHWLRGTYRPTAARTAAAVMTLRDDRCRRNLAAELEAIEVARSKAMVAGDVNGARHEPLAALRQIDKVVARIRAVSAAIDREFDRLDGVIRKAGLATTLGESLRALRLHKQGGWPRAASASEMAREVAAFEAGVSRLAALVARKAASAANTARA